MSAEPLRHWWGSAMFEIYYKCRILLCNPDMTWCVSLEQGLGVKEKIVILGYGEIHVNFYHLKNINEQIMTEI